MKILYLGNIPEDMIEYEQWVCWYENKRPVDPKKTRISYASVTNPETWGTYGQAVDTYHRLRLSGIGFVFTEDDPYVGIDIDNCDDQLIELVEKNCPNLSIMKSPWKNKKK